VDGQRSEESRAVVRHLGGAVLCVIAAALVWRGRIAEPRSWARSVSCCWCVALRTRRSSSGERDLVAILARARSYQRARAADAAVSLVLTPLSLLWRLTAKDPLTRRRDRWPGWSTYPARVPRQASLHTDVLRFIWAKGRVLVEFWQFLLQEKKYWLVPIIIVFVLFGLLIVFSQSSAVAPFIYTLF